MSRAKTDHPTVDPDRNAALDAEVTRFIRDVTGDPRLTWWECNFINSMAIWVAPDGPGAHRLSEKQWAVIAQITAKVDAPLVDDLADSPEELVDALD